MLIKNIFLRNISLSLVSQVLLALFTIISIPLFLKKLGFELYGIYILINTFNGYANILNNVILKALIKYLAELNVKNDSRAIANYVTSGLLINIVIALFGFFLILSIGYLYIIVTGKISEELITQYYYSIIFSSLSILFLLIGDTFWAFPTSQQKFQFSIIKDSIFGLMHIMGSIVLIQFGGSIKEIFFYKFLLSFIYLIYFILIFKSLNKFYIGFIRKHLINRLVKFGISKFISDLNSQIIFQSDKLFISFFVPVSLLPYYYIPLSIIQRITFMILTITPPIFPFLVHLHNSKRDKYTETYLRISKWVNLILILFFAFTFVFAYSILNLLINEDFAVRSELILKLLSLSYLMYGFAALPTLLFESLGKPNTPAVFALLTSFVQVTLFMFLIPRYSLLGSALSLLLTSVLIETIFVYYSLLKIRVFSIKLIFKHFIFPFILAICICFILSFYHLTVDSKFNLITYNAFQFILVSIFYFSTLFYFKIISLEEVKLIASSFHILKSTLNK